MNIMMLFPALTTLFTPAFLDAIAIEEVSEEITHNSIFSVLLYCIPVIIIAILLILIVKHFRK